MTPPDHEHFPVDISLNILDLKYKPYLFAKEIAKIPDDNLQLLATAFIAGATAKLLNRDAHTSAEAAVYAVHYNAHGHRRWFDGEVVYRDGKYYRYDKARDKEDEIEKPEEGMYIWKDDEDGSGNGQDYKIVSKKQNRTGFEQIDAIYDSVELTLDGTPVIGFSSNSSPTYIPTKPFQGKVIDRATKPIRQIILSPLSILADFGWKYSEFSKGFSTAVAEDFTPNFLSGAQMPTKNRNPYSFDTPYSLSGRIVGHGFSAIGGVVEFAAGVGTAAGGSVAAGSSVVAAPAVPAAAAAGATMATHGAITVGQASKNLADDLSRFNSSTSGNKVLKSTDKTPQGRTITDHAAERMNERGFSGRDIDNIIANNKKNRVKEVDENGQITWRYQDKRGNTVITDESGERIVTVYSHPKKINGGNYIPKE